MILYRMAGGGIWTVPCVYLTTLLMSYISSVQCQGGQCSSGVLNINPNADVKFSVIMTIRESNDGSTCGTSVSQAAIQNIAVMKWAVDRINQGSFVRGVTIGFDVYDDCGLRRKSINQALDVLDGFPLGTKACFTSSGTACHMGIIGTSRSSTTEAVLYALNGTSLPVISPYATYPSLSRYSNFYRTASSDDVQIKAVVHMLKSLNLTYVAVVNEDNIYGHYAAGRMNEIAREHGVCVDVVQTIQTGADLNPDTLIQQRDRTKDKSLRVVFFGSKGVAQSMLSELRFHNTDNINWVLFDHMEDDVEPFESKDINNGTIIVSQSATIIKAAEEYISQTWKKVIFDHTASDDLERLMACSGNTQVPKWIYANVFSTVDAVYVFASALQRQQPLYCNGDPGVCNSLKEDFKFVIKEVMGHPVVYRDISANVTVSEFAADERVIDFHDTGEMFPNPEASLFEMSIVSIVKKVTEKKKIGEYRNDTFHTSNNSLAVISSLETSVCKDGCPVCLHIPEIPFAYMDGESLLLGIFSVHETDPNNPFKCANLRTSQMDVIIVESFLYTVESMRNETGINFGAVVIDDCYSAARTELVLSQILANKVKLKKPNSDEFIDISKVLVVISSLGSTVTIPVTLLLAQVNIPSISSSASSPDLDDRINFPYFLRTVPSDVEQVKAMVSIIKKMRWEYVSLLYVKNNYGSKGKEAFLRMANASGICVADAPEGITATVDNKTTSELNSVFTRLINHQSDVVVYFGTEARITNFLQVMKGNIPFIFLGSEDWGDRQYILEMGGQNAKGSITLKNEAAGLFDDPFKEYIKSVNPSTNVRNPWFIEYWEQTFQCDLPQSFNNKYNKLCDPNRRFTDETVQEFLKDQRIVHTVDSVKAVAKGLKVSKTKICNFDSFPCSKYFQYIDIVVKNIREVTINRDGQEVRVFKEDGNGNVGFGINNVQDIYVDGKVNLDYVTVGSYKESRLNLDTTKLHFFRPAFDGQCSGRHCSRCDNSSLPNTTSMATTTHAHPQDEGFATPDFTIIGILGFLFVVIIILCIVIICYFKRRITELEKLTKTSFEMWTGYMASMNGSASNMHSASVTYPELQFANTSPSGDTLYEWRKAQHHLTGNGHIANGGVINKAFVGSEMYSHTQHTEDENQNYPNTSSANVCSNTGHSSSQMDQSTSHLLPEKSVYKPSSNTSYGLSSHSSFKRPSDANVHVKKQPRTQLAVPPCRPELPPRDQHRHMHTNRPNTFPDNFNHISSAVPKEKVRKVRSSPRRTAPPSLKYSPSTGENSSYTNRRDMESPMYKGSPTNMTFSAGSVQPKEQQVSPSGMINLAGSMEKISRV